MFASVRDTHIHALAKVEYEAQDVSNLHLSPHGDLTFSFCKFALIANNGRRRTIDGMFLRNIASSDTGT